MTKIQNSKPVLVIGYWNLIFCDAPLLRQTAATGKEYEVPSEGWREQLVVIKTR